MEKCEGPDLLQFGLSNLISIQLYQLFLKFRFQALVIIIRVKLCTTFDK